jgi:very-short-patch-repair endonuclease
LLDLAGVVGADELRNAVTQAEVHRRFDLSSLREVIDRNRGRRGVARLRRAIAEHEPRDERAREGLERTFLALCRRADLPPPEVNVPLLVGGVQLEADFLWRDARLIVETDDRRSHATITAFEKDRRRDRRLIVAGWRVLRCTWRQVADEPVELARAIRTVLGQSSHS